MSDSCQDEHTRAFRDGGLGCACSGVSHAGKRLLRRLGGSHRQQRHVVICLWTSPFQRLISRLLMWHVIGRCAVFAALNRARPTGKNRFVAKQIPHQGHRWRVTANVKHVHSKQILFPGVCTRYFYSILHHRHQHQSLCVHVR